MLLLWLFVRIPAPGPHPSLPWWLTLGSTQGQEDPLEKGMATHSSILAWRIPWTEEPRITESDTTKQLRVSLWPLVPTPRSWSISKGEPRTLLPLLPPLAHLTCFENF